MSDPTRPDSRPVELRLSDDRVAAIRRLIIDEAAASDQRGISRRETRRRPLLVAAAGAGVLLVGGTAAAWVAATRPADPYSGYCSTSSTTDRDVWSQHGFGSAEDAQSGARARASIDTCAQMWRMGLVTDSSVPAGTVPTLTACVVGGALVVYPSDAQICGRLKVPAAIVG